jgi:hypothetical protein
MGAQIILEDYQGRHNASDYVSRLAKARAYEDLSTVCIVPTRGLITARVVQNWMGILSPMNQKFTRIFVERAEVGDAYNWAIDAILSNEELSKWKYVLTLEEDNLAPPDGLLKLIESIGDYGAVGGLYWTKGEGGMPMCYGHPHETPIRLNPIIPQPDSLTECNGLGMGFTLFKLDLFKDPKIEKPWFRTAQEFIPGEGVKCMTQDLYFFEKAKKAGYRFACDSRVRVGHFDAGSNIVW